MKAPLVPGFSDALVVLDVFGIAVFAVSGALLAAEKRQTLVTFIFFAVVTGVGGGTLRDLLIGAPVFWVHTNSTLLICIGAALAVWAVSRRRFSEQALLWFDAAGLAAYSTYGAAKALGFGVAPVPAFAMGVLTACIGGIVRDVLAGRALDPDAAGALRDRRRALGGPVRRTEPCRPDGVARRCSRDHRRFRPSRRGNQARLVLAGLSGLREQPLLRSALKCRHKAPRPASAG